MPLAEHHTTAELSTFSVRHAVVFSPASISLGMVLLIFSASPLSAGPRPAAEGTVFYLDGSGGGGLLLSWAGSVEKGLREAGFHGQFSEFTWQTGLGPGADQLARTSYKRRKAEACAARIRERIDRNPAEPVILIGLSAGTVIALYTLEALPAGYQVDNVVLLSSSVSAEYDLTAALRRVRGRLYTFVSRADAVLDVLVPLTGTADRQFCGDCAAGARGFHLPFGASAVTREQYAKVRNIPWKPAYVLSGHFGHHTGSTRSAFIRQYVAPLILQPPLAATAVNAGPVTQPASTRPSR